MSAYVSLQRERSSSAVAMVAVAQRPTDASSLGVAGKVLPGVPKLGALGVPVIATVCVLAATSCFSLINSNSIMYLLGDVLSAVAAAAAISPAIALIDSAVARSSSSGAPVIQELRQLLGRRCQATMTTAQLLMVGLVYSATYLAVNLCRSGNCGCILRLVLVTGINMWTGILKDSFIAKTQDASRNPRAMPKSTVALFCLRDTNAVGASFVIPQALGGLASCWPAAEVMVQLCVPPLCETVNTPLHLLALDCYNRPLRSIGDRARYLWKKLPSVLPVRIIRCMSAFAFGSLGNRALRDTFLRVIEEGGAVVQIVA